MKKISLNIRNALKNIYFTKNKHFFGSFLGHYGVQIYSARSHHMPKLITFAACQLPFPWGHKQMGFDHHSDEDIPGVDGHLASLAGWTRLICTYMFVPALAWLLQKQCVSCWLFQIIPMNGHIWRTLVIIAWGNFCLWNTISL